MKRFKKPLLILFFVAFVVIAGGYTWFRSITNKIFIPQSSTASAAVDSIQQNFNNKTAFNIVLLGYGGGTHDGAYLTDSIMVVRVDPKNQKIFLISIPRDIWIKIPTDGNDGSYWKVNAAYELGLDDTNYPNKQPQFKNPDGGGHLAEYIISHITGLPVSYFVGMDFSGFKHTIDTLGGVDINVNPAFTDYSYPIDGKEDDSCGLTSTQIASFSAQIASGSATESQAFPCRFEVLHFDAGLQHMDGERALSYVRSRHSATDGTDFGRAGRQRNLLVAVKKKVFSAGFIPQVIPFMSSLGDDLRTDMSLNDVKTLIANSNALNKYSVTMMALTDQNYLVDAVSDDGQDVLEPKDGINDWTGVHNYISSTISGKKQPIAAIVQVENGTSIPGLAGLASNRLQNENIQTLTPADADIQNYQTSKIIVYNKLVDSEDIDTLEKEFKVSSISYANGQQKQYNILVIVGQNYNSLEGKEILNEP